MVDKSPELSDIIDLGHLQAVHDIFSEQTGLASAVLDNKARPITFECNHCSFCREVRKTKAGVQQCRFSDQEGIELARKKFERTGKADPVIYICKRGLVDFCAPIALHGKILAYFFSGQFRCSGGKFKTPDQPLLDGLLEMAGTTKEKPNKVALNNKFKDVKELDQKAFRRVKKALVRLAEQLNSVVNKLDDSKPIRKVNDFMKKTIDAQNVEDLFELTVNSLPEMMEAKYCSVFTIQRGESNDRDRLVLRKTSFPDLKPEENSACYEKGEGLTGWVWKHARSLRLKDVDDKAELAYYGDDLEWKRKHNDSKEHKGFLCAPMIGRNREVIGLIRMPHKIRKPNESEEEEKGFTKQDEIFLNFLGRYISWVIEYQAADEKFERAMSLVNTSTELAKAWSHGQILKATLKNSLTLFGGEGKRHFVCSHKPYRKRWKIRATGGSLGLDTGWEGRRFAIDDGFTGKVIRTGNSLISSDLNELEEYLHPVKDGKSAISAPIIWADKIYGAISIISNKNFEFSREKDLKLLEILGQLAGDAIRRTKFWTNVLRIFGKILRRLPDLGKAAIYG